MSKLERLNARVSKLLTSAVQEVLEVVKDTVSEYQEKTARTQRENERLQRKLQELQQRLQLPPVSRKDVVTQTVFRCTRSEPEFHSTQEVPAPKPEVPPTGGKGEGQDSSQLEHLLPSDREPPTTGVSCLDDKDIPATGWSCLDDGELPATGWSCLDDGKLPAAGISCLDDTELSVTDGSVKPEKTNTAPSLFGDSEALRNSDSLDQTPPTKTFQTPPTRTFQTPPTPVPHDSWAADLHIIKTEPEVLEYSACRHQGAQRDSGHQRDSEQQHTAQQRALFEPWQEPVVLGVGSPCRPVLEVQLGGAVEPLCFLPPQGGRGQGVGFRTAGGRGQGTRLLPSGRGLGEGLTAAEGRGQEVGFRVRGRGQEAGFRVRGRGHGVGFRVAGGSGLRGFQQHRPPSMEDRHRCVLCGKTFSRLDNLRIHQRCHTGEQPYACGVCGRRFSHAGNLQKHKRIHTGEKPYGCVQCGKTFSQSTHLKKHQQIHRHTHRTLS